MDATPQGRVPCDVRHDALRNLRFRRICIPGYSDRELRPVVDRPNDAVFSCAVQRRNHGGGNHSEPSIVIRDVIRIHHKIGNRCTHGLLDLPSANHYVDELAVAAYAVAHILALMVIDIGVDVIREERSQCGRIHIYGGDPAELLSLPGDGLRIVSEHAPHPRRMHAGVGRIGRIGVIADDRLRIFQGQGFRGRLCN